jgi:hydrogenase nickel incorporation protein HypB
MTCGCGHDDVHVEGMVHTHADGTTHSHAHGARHEHEHGDGELHTHADGRTHRHAHDHTHDHTHDHGHDHGQAELHDGAPNHLHYGLGAAGNAVPGVSQSRLVQIERDILSKNDGIAQRNRAALAQRGIFALNLVSSPGSGKTTLLVRTIEMLAGRLPVAVIEGDQQTTFDAERIRATGAPALQINTGKGCHLDAAMVETALQRLAPAEDAVLMIENVGNLVCPAGFDLGEAHKVVVLSVTEGEDKPLKYPDMFHAASLMLLNKVDLLPHLRFDVERCLDNARRVNPGIQILQLSATTDQGMDRWLDWIESGARAARRPRLDQVSTLQQRVAELEAQVARLQPR